MGQIERWVEESTNGGRRVESRGEYGWGDRRNGERAGKIKSSYDN